MFILTVSTIKIHITIKSIDFEFLFLLKSKEFSLDIKTLLDSLFIRFIKFN